MTGRQRPGPSKATEDKWDFSATVPRVAKNFPSALFVLPSLVNPHPAVVSILFYCYLFNCQKRKEVAAKRWSTLGEHDNRGESTITFDHKQ